MEYENSFFLAKQGVLVSHSRDWDESRVPVASYQTRLDCTFCPVVI